MALEPTKIQAINGWICKNFRQLASTDMYIPVCSLKVQNQVYYQLSCGLVCQNFGDVIQNSMPFHGSSYFDTLL